MDSFKLNKGRVNDGNSYAEGTEHILSTSQSKDGEVPSSPRLANPSSLSSHKQTVPEANLEPNPSTFSSRGRGSIAGRSTIHYHRHNHHIHYHHHHHYYKRFLPVGQVKGGNGSSSDTSSMVIIMSL